MPVDHGHPIAQQQLPVARPARGPARSVSGTATLRRLARDITGRSDLAAQGFQRDAVVGGGQPAIDRSEAKHRTARPCSTARAPWPTPPLGRPGASVVWWP